MRFIALAAASFGISSLLSAADPQLLNLVMPDAQVVAGVNVAKAKTSQFGQYLLRQIPMGGEFAIFVGSSGFDPTRDLSEVLMATPSGQKDGLVVAKGAFNTSQIATLVAADGKHSVVTYSGAQLITSNDPTHPEALAFFDGNLAAVGNATMVKAALDRRKSANPVNPQLASKVAMYGAADAWTVSLVPLSGVLAAPGAGQDANPLQGILQTGMLNKVSETSGSVTFNSPVQVAAELVTDSSQDAKALGDVMKLLAAMMQMSGDKSTAALAGILQTLTINTVGNALKLGLSIPEATLEGLIDSAGAHDAKKSGAIKI